jgi:hypothetical protein
MSDESAVLGGAGAMASSSSAAPDTARKLIKSPISKRGAPEATRVARMNRTLTPELEKEFGNNAISTQKFSV